MAKVIITIEDKESVGGDNRISLRVESDIPYSFKESDWTEAQYFSTVAIQAISDDIQGSNPKILSVTSKSR